MHFHKEREGIHQLMFFSKYQIIHFSKKKIEFKSQHCVEINSKFHSITIIIQVMKIIIPQSKTDFFFHSTPKET